MTQEEKKAIEYLKNNHIPVLRYDNYGNILEPLYYGIEEKETLLNLIEKLQKENEELKIKNCRKNQIIYAYEERTDISEGELAELIDLEEE